MDGEGHGYSQAAVEKLQGRLWRNPKTKPLNGVHCLEYDAFAGYVNPKGYARLSIDGRMRYAHRTALEIALDRRLPPELLALHGCDNPLCCEPLHLSAGPVLANNADRDAKGRNHQTYGKRRRLMSRDTAERIILAMAIETHWDGTMASRFGCSPEAIAHIRKGRSWAWLKADLAPEIERRRREQKTALG